MENQELQVQRKREVETKQESTNSGSPLRTCHGHRSSTESAAVRTPCSVPSSRGRGGIEPYYRAHREFDQAFNRVYSPNEAADKTYYKDQQARTEKYLEYLREADPKKRAELYREYNQQSLRVGPRFRLGLVASGRPRGGDDRAVAGFPVAVRLQPRPPHRRHRA